MGWPALVVGHRGSGKTSIIQRLAAGVGARLTEVAMTPSVDVTELLGCFEQVWDKHVQLFFFYPMKSFVLETLDMSRECFGVVLVLLLVRPPVVPSIRISG